MRSLGRLPRIQLLVGVSVLIVVAELFANIVEVGGGDEDAAGGVGAFLGLSAFGIAVSALLLLVVVPRTAPDAQRTAALGFGVAALVSVVAFWSALPFAFGAAALATAAAADEANREATPGALATAGAGLGALAIVLAFVACVLG